MGDLHVVTRGTRKLESPFTRSKHKFADNMLTIATYYQSQMNPIGPPSITAVCVVTVFALLVRFLHENPKLVLTFLLPYALLMLVWFRPFSLTAGRFWDVDHHFAIAIYLASSFGFALHNFQLKDHLFWRNAVVSTMLTGTANVAYAADWAFMTGWPPDYNHGAYWSSIVAFMSVWSFVCYRSSRSNHWSIQLVSDSDS